MKFVMSKQLCVPKTNADVHKELVQKPDLGRSKYEQLGPEEKYRDEYYEIYKLKCEEFKMKGKAIRDANIKALSNTRMKLGEMYKPMLEDEEYEKNVQLDAKSDLKVTSLTSTSSIDVIRESGIALRKRHERYYNDTWNVNDKPCEFEPWFRRYLILCRFINAARKVILKHRMLKRLEMLNKLKKDRAHRKEIIQEYQNQYVTCQHLIYPHIFEKFIK